MTPIPHSIEAERATLASFLLEPGDVGAICNERGIGSAHFHLPQHQVLFERMAGLWKDGQSVDYVTLTNALGSRLEEIGGPPYIHELAAMLPSAANLRSHLAILEETGMRRQIMALADKAKQDAQEGQEAASTVLGAMIAQAGDIAAPTVKRAPTMKELAMDKINRMQKGEVRTDILRTGIAKLDEHSPLYLGAMPLISGERKAGKSILSITISLNLCAAGKRGLYFSLEEPTPNVVDRIMANLSKVPILKHTATGLSEREFAGIIAAAEKMSSLPLTIYDDVFDLGQMAGIIRRHKARYPDLAFVVVDYAQLVSVTLEKGANREQHVAAVSRMLRRLSMELKVAMLVLCQLNNDGNTRESKALEQDATAMWKVSSPDEDHPGERWINIPWQRGGDSAIKFPVTFLGHLARFDNHASE